MLEKRHLPHITLEISRHEKQKNLVQATFFFIVPLWGVDEDICSLRRSPIDGSHKCGTPEEAKVIVVRDIKEFDQYKWK